jgi:hypothetical protein
VGALSFTSQCGDVIERDGDRLVVDAALPIEGLEESRYRKPVLVFREQRFVLERVSGTAKRPRYELRLPEDNAYVPEGTVVYYDDERHLDRRRQRQRTALAWILWIPSVPLMPLLGLLSQETKEKMGLDVGRATRVSLAIEYLILAVGVIAYFAVGGFFSPPGAVIGTILLVTAADIAHRVASDYDNKSPGLYSIIPATWRFLRALRSDRAGVLDAADVHLAISDDEKRGDKNGLAALAAPALPDSASRDPKLR